MNASPSHCNCSDGGGGGGDALPVSPEYGHEGGAGRNDVGMSPVKRKEEAIGRAAARFPAAGSIGAGGIAMAARRLVLVMSLSGSALGNGTIALLLAIISQIIGVNPIL